MSVSPASPDRPRGVIDHVAVALSTTFYTSFIPATIVSRSRHRGAETLTRRKWTGAGIIGSFWGLATYIHLPHQWGLAWPALAGGIALSIIASDRAEAALGVHDDPRIVIDEWIGCWIAVYGLPPEWGLPTMTGLILFRIFDVLKGPWGRWLQKLPGGFGVTLDDVVAGVIANVVLRLVVLYFPGY
jgi:phosphatidylglycerophosphatase A